MRRSLLLCSVLILWVLTGCSGQATGSNADATTSSAVGAAPSSAPTSEVNPCPPVPVSAPTAAPTCGERTVNITGTCGSYKLESGGFTPGKLYQTVAWYPDGSPYSHLQREGEGELPIQSDGSIPEKVNSPIGKGWSWDCTNGAGGEHDRAGEYPVAIVELKYPIGSTNYRNNPWAMAKLAVS